MKRKTSKQILPMVFDPDSPRNVDTPELSENSGKWTALKEWTASEIFVKTFKEKSPLRWTLIILLAYSISISVYAFFPTSDFGESQFQIIEKEVQMNTTENFLIFPDFLTLSENELQAEFDEAKKNWEAEKTNYENKIEKIQKDHEKKSTAAERNFEKQIHNLREKARKIGAVENSEQLESLNNQLKEETKNHNAKSEELKLRIQNLENDLKEKYSSHESIKSNLEEKLEESQDKIEDLKADQAKSEKRITELKAERLDLISKIADGQDMAKQLTKQIQDLTDSNTKLTEDKNSLMQINGKITEFNIKLDEDYEKMVFLNEKLERNITALINSNEDLEMELQKFQDQIYTPEAPLDTQPENFDNAESQDLKTENLEKENTEKDQKLPENSKKFRSWFNQS